MRRLRSDESDHGEPYRVDARIKSGHDDGESDPQAGLISRAEAA
jgi:hypothetical protein